jgi:hypothetical protein
MEGTQSKRRAPDSAMQRDYLIHLLTEAAELEHNLCCSYLYAAFSLKREAECSGAEGKAVARWRKAIIGIAVAEMGHLALVNNLLVAVGGAAHLDRPNLPVPEGYHPAGVVIRLRPLTPETLQHFIFLERPETSSRTDGEGYRRGTMGRVATAGDLTPSTPDYETIGEFYSEIKSTFAAFGDASILPRSESRQMSPSDVPLPGLIVVRNKSDAMTALDTIIEQGEGMTSARDDSHFATFKLIETEWRQLEAANPGFEPAVSAANDPVMRKPATGLARVWVN